MAIEMTGLTKSYGATQALAGVNLRFDEGKIYGLLGRNGAGKTTLLNIITGRLFADGGAVTVDGAPAAENDEAMRKLYMLSEATYYPPAMRVAEALRWSAVFYPGFDTPYADSLCAAFALDKRKKVSALSTGYNTILKLVIALACGAPYVLLDEPVLGLDANHRELFYKALLERYSQKPACYVLSTHLVEEVSTLIEDVVVIHAGQVLKNQSRESLLAQGYTVTGPAARVDAFAAGKTLLGTDAIGGLKTVYILGERGEVPEGLETTRLDLQKLFVRLTSSPEEGGSIQ